MDELSRLPNIGKEIEKNLKFVGVNTQQDLKSIGSRKAFMAIRLKDPTACVNMLYALEGAVQGIRWHDLSRDDKISLKSWYNSL